jgi:hypothetical protein
MKFESITIAEPGGPYDIATEELRVRFEAEACLLIVLSGKAGTGFSISGPEDIKPHLPHLFHSIAREVENALFSNHHAMVCPACCSPLAFDPRQEIEAGDVPEGSITVCAACTSFLTLDPEWRVMSDEDLIDLDDDMRDSLTRTRREIHRRRATQ